MRGGIGGIVVGDVPHDLFYVRPGLWCTLAPYK
jgi:hypothetical protein